MGRVCRQVWIFSLKVAVVDLVVNKCTLTFPAADLFRKVFANPDVTCLVFSPVDLNCRSGQDLPSVWEDPALGFAVPGQSDV